MGAVEGGRRVSEGEDWDEGRREPCAEEVVGVNVSLDVEDEIWVASEACMAGAGDCGIDVTDFEVELEVDEDTTTEDVDDGGGGGGGTEVDV